jgi:hypothetical protein
MNRIRQIGIILASFGMALGLTACDTLSDCVFGADVVEERVLSVPPFHSIQLFDQLELVLNASQEEALILKGESHLLAGIQSQLRDSVLSLQSTASCQWRHPKARLQVFVNYQGLRKITQSGFGKIQALDTLEFEQLVLEVLNGTGTIELPVQGNSLQIVSNGLANIHLSGSLQRLTAGFYYNDGQLHAGQLRAQEVILNHYGSNFMKVFPQKLLRANLQRNGDILCVGQPETVELQQKGSGQLLYLD